MKKDARRYAPAVARNREPILEVLRPYLPSRGLVLEVASGSGEHVSTSRRRTLPISSSSRAIQIPAPCKHDVWTGALGLPISGRAIARDAASEIWRIACADSLLCINMIHIAPWAGASA